MNTISWFGLTILFIIFVVISLLAYLTIAIYLKIKNHKATDFFNLRKLWLQIWLIITESAGLFLFFKPFIAFFSWIAVICLTLIICKKQNNKVRIVNRYTEKESLSCRIDNEERETQQKFIRYCNRNLYKTVYFCFSIFFIARLITLIPALDISIDYGIIQGYFYNLLQFLSVASLLMFIIYILQIVGPYWYSRFNWCEDKGYRLIICIAYYSMVFVVGIIFTLLYFGVVE